MGREDDTVTLFLDGVSVATKVTSVVCNNNHNNLFRIGEACHTTGYEFQGYMDEIHVSKGIARWTSNFTPPTQPYSGIISSIDYTDIGQPDKHEFWDLRFNSTTPIFTHTYSIKIPQGEFNRTMNSSIRIGVSGSVLPDTNVKRLANMRNELTGSEWSPYFNQIQLFRDDDGEAPLIIANLPRNVKVRDDMDLTITFRIDY